MCRPSGLLKRVKILRHAVKRNCFHSGQLKCRVYSLSRPFLESTKPQYSISPHTLHSMVHSLHSFQHAGTMVLLQAAWCILDSRVSMVTSNILYFSLMSHT